MKRFIIDVKETSQTDHPGDSLAVTLPMPEASTASIPFTAAPVSQQVPALTPHTLHSPAVRPGFFTVLILGFLWQMSHSTKTFILGAVTQERT